MPLAALDLNDAALTLLAGGEVLACEPGVAAWREGALCFGEAAESVARARPREVQRRYWREPGGPPLAVPLGDCRTPADLAGRHLRRLWGRLPAGCGGLVVVAHPAWGAAEVADFLGIAAGAGVPVAGVVDPAVAASRRPCPGAELWHLDLTLHDATLTRVLQQDGAVAGARGAVPAGREQLQRAAAGYFARCFLETSRFDPLHDGGSEQRLYDELPGWRAQLAREARADLRLTWGRHDFAARVTRAGLEAAVATALEPLSLRLRALGATGAGTVLQVPALLAEVPGAAAVLGAVPGLRTVVLAPAEAARGALRLRPAAGEPTVLVTRLPWDQPPLAAGAAAAAPASAPTHVHHAGRLWRLGAAPFEIGQEAPAQGYGVALGARALGVSRRHCTIRREPDGRVTLSDHSRYGTLLNGHRVDGPAILQAGDRVAVGQPALEFQLLAEVEADGPPA